MDAQQIRQLRDDLGLTQAEFAAQLQTQVATVSRWETGQRKPSPYYARQLELLRATARSVRQDQRELDLDLFLARATADEPSQAAMDAVEHAEQQHLSPLALALAGSAARARGYGESEAEWIMSKGHLDRATLDAAVRELMNAGLWPWS